MISFEYIVVVDSMEGNHDGPRAVVTSLDSSCISVSDHLFQLCTVNASCVCWWLGDHELCMVVEGNCLSCLSQVVDMQLMLQVSVRLCVAI